MPCNSASVMLSVGLGLFVKLNVNLYICTGLVVSWSEKYTNKNKRLLLFRALLRVKYES